MKDWQKIATALAVGTMLGVGLVVWFIRIAMWNNGITF